MKPSLGRIVIAHVPAEYNNGSTEAPAVIVRVWNDDVVNLRVFVDNPGEVLSRTSVRLLAEKPADPIVGQCWWPARVSE